MQEIVWAAVILPWTPLQSLHHQLRPPKQWGGELNSPFQKKTLFPVSPASFKFGCSFIILLFFARLQLEMWDEIFKFESFINFTNFLKYFKTPLLKFSLKFCILIIIHQ